MDSLPIISINNIGLVGQDQFAGGTVAHYLALNQLNIEQVEIMAANLGITKNYDKPGEQIMSGIQVKEEGAK